MSDRKNSDFSNRITACEGTECEGVIIDLHRMSDRKNSDFSNRITACEGTECEGVIIIFAREMETRKEMEVINPKF